mmetsp:Transcript_19/g.42  ORF Transcript_19/g.42 Transcript_19/m.42 type:complete len:226 (+) Transcript_19:405-1082(+)
MFRSHPCFAHEIKTPFHTLRSVKRCWEYWNRSQSSGLQFLAREKKILLARDGETGDFLCESSSATLAALSGSLCSRCASARYQSSCRLASEIICIFIRRKITLTACTFPSLAYISRIAWKGSEGRLPNVFVLIHLLKRCSASRWSLARPRASIKSAQSLPACKSRLVPGKPLHRLLSAVRARLRSSARQYALNSCLRTCKVFFKYSPHFPLFATRRAFRGSPFFP